jgi:hypothetical protein
MRSAIRAVPIGVIGLFFTLATVHGMPASPQAQSQAAKPRSESTERRYTLDIESGERFIEVALKAEAAKLSDIAVDLSKRLGARVTLGPSLQQQTISVEFPQSSLETALARLAPRVFVDYEIGQETGAKPREVYLLGPTDAAPAMDTEKRGKSQGLLVMGHTEEMPAAPGEDPLKIAGDRQGLMLTVKHQPLSVVAMAIADVLGIPLELKYTGGEPVDLDIKYYAPLEDLIPSVSPHIRLVQRVDVIGQQRVPLKLVVERAAAK